MAASFFVPSSKPSLPKEEKKFTYGIEKLTNEIKESKGIASTEAIKLVPSLSARLSQLGDRDLKKIIFPIERELKKESKSSESPLLDFYIAFELLISIKQLFLLSDRVIVTALDFICKTPHTECYQKRAKQIGLVAWICKYSKVHQLIHARENALNQLYISESLLFDINRKINREEDFLIELLFVLHSEEKNYEVIEDKTRIERLFKASALENFDNLAILKDFEEFSVQLEFIFNCIETILPERTYKERQTHLNEILGVVRLGIKHVTLLVNLCSLIKQIPLTSIQVSDYLNTIANLDLSENPLPGFEDYVMTRNDPTYSKERFLYKIFEDLPDKKIEPEDRECLSKTALLLEKNRFETESAREEFILNTAYFAATRNFSFTFRFCLEQQTRDGSYVLNQTTLMRPFLDKTCSNKRLNFLNLLMIAIKNYSVDIAKIIILSDRVKLNDLLSPLEFGLIPNTPAKNYLFPCGEKTILGYACTQGLYSFAEKLIILGARFFGKPRGFQSAIHFFAGNPNSESLLRIFKFFAQEDKVTTLYYPTVPPTHKEEDFVFFDLFCQAYNLPQRIKFHKEAKKTSSFKHSVSSFFGLSTTVGTHAPVTTQSPPNPLSSTPRPKLPGS